jgi:hypothetical protein
LVVSNIESNSLVIEGASIFAVCRGIIVIVERAFIVFQKLLSKLFLNKFYESHNIIMIMID